VYTGGNTGYLASGTADSSAAGIFASQDYRSDTRPAWDDTGELMPETNTARSKHYLEKQGWKCCTVEQTVRILGQFGQPPKMFKRDAFNYGDLLTFNPCEYCAGLERCAKEIAEFYDRNATMIPRAHHILSIMEKYVNSGIALVQTTSRSNQSERINKIHEIPEAEGWLKSGGRIFVHGWKLTGPRGAKRKTWEVQVTELGTEDEKKITAEEAPLFVGEDDF
jgi:hypothetical protein